jgi:16S rRNA (cytidine1402-2'-O)-methyltransferase
VRDESRTWDAPGRLVLAATPIGDVDDASPRLARLIAEADVVAAEDTRRLRRLAAALGVRPRGRILSYNEINERTRAKSLIAAAAGGATVLVVTDAGMPSVSDPGLRAVRAALDAGIPVTAVPGPSAVLTALALSGLATDRFCFEGFLPRGHGERARALEALAGEPRTMVFFEAARRLSQTLAEMAEVFGADRPGAVCRELTKTYEEVVREPLGALAAWATRGEVLGEVTVVVAGRPAVPLDAADVDRLASLVVERVAAGERIGAAASAVASASGASRNALYRAATEARAKRRPGEPGGA